MTDEHSLRGLLHWATHRIPGVPDHAEQPRRAPGPSGAPGPCVAPGPFIASTRVAESQVEPFAGSTASPAGRLAAPDRHVLRSGAVMKAAVLHAIGGIPRYEDFPDPVAGDDEVIIDVKAVAVENVDKLIAAGTHDAGQPYIAQLPAIRAFAEDSPAVRTPVEAVVDLHQVHIGWNVPDELVDIGGGAGVCGVIEVHEPRAQAGRVDVHVVLPLTPTRGRNPIDSPNLEQPRRRDTGDGVTAGPPRLSRRPSTR